MKPIGLAALVLALAGPGIAVAQDPEGGCAATYTVRQGDTLSSIATRCGRSVEALLEANSRLADPGRLSIGQELTVPDRGGSPATAEDEPGRDMHAGTGVYTVEPGDSMAGIAARLGLALRDLRAANEAVDPLALQPGQKLALPVAPAEAGEESAQRVDASPAHSSEQATTAPDDMDRQGAPAAEESVRSEPVPERLALEGRIQNGVECPILRTPDGALYSLVSQSYGFTPGDYVTIEGEAVEMSFCDQGNTVRVTSMTAKPAPRGG